MNIFLSLGDLSKTLNLYSEDGVHTGIILQRQKRGYKQSKVYKGGYILRGGTSNRRLTRGVIYKEGVQAIKG